MTTAGEAADAPSSQGQRRVYIIDDDGDVRKSLSFLLSTASMTVWTFSSATDFLAELRCLVPAPILLDVRMADIDGLQLLAMLEERSILWPVIVMTAHGEVVIAVRAMKLGAIEFLEKPFDPDVLHQALEHAFAILEQLEGTLRSRDQARALIERLSSREREVLGILAEGVPNKLVAHRLGITVRTVEMHRGNALAKLSIKSIAEFMTIAALAQMPPRSA